MKASFLIVYAILSTSLLKAYFNKNIEIKRNYSKKLDYKRAINLSNQYAIKGDVNKAYYYAIKAYKLNASKESLYLISRILNYKKEYLNLLIIAGEILKKDKNDYLGLKYKTIALINLKSPLAIDVAKKGYKLYKEDFEKLLDLAYNI